MRPQCTAIGGEDVLRRDTGYVCIVGSTFPPGRREVLPKEMVHIGDLEIRTYWMQWAIERQPSVS